MPLLPERINTVKIDGAEGDSYTLKEMISGYERRKVESAGMLVQMTRDQFDKRLSGSDRANDLIYMKPNAHDMQLEMLLIYLVSWSHGESITRRTLKRLPPADWDMLISKVAELQEAQYGPTEEDHDGPLGEPSIE